MFKAIEAITEATAIMMFTKRNKVTHRKRPEVIRRVPTPRPTDEEVLEVLTGQLHLETAAKAKPSMEEQPIKKPRASSI